MGRMAGPRSRRGVSPEVNIYGEKCACRALEGERLWGVPRVVDLTTGRRATDGAK